MGNALNSIVYQPPSPATYPDTLEHLRFIPSGKNSIATVVRQCQPSNQKTDVPILVLYSHGNAEDLGGLYSFLGGLAFSLANRTNAPCIVVGYDYPGYGRSSGSPSEENVFSAAHDVLMSTIKEYSVPWNRVVLWGKSLGSGPTCYLAHTMFRKMDTPFTAIILQSPLLSIFRVGLRSSHYTRLPFDQFRNYERVRDGAFGENTKVFVVHGMDDEVVPFAHGRTIYECIPHKNRYSPLFVKGAGHNDVEIRLWKSSASAPPHAPRALTDHAVIFIEKYLIESNLQREEN